MCVTACAEGTPPSKTALRHKPQGCFLPVRQKNVAATKFVRFAKGSG